MAKKADKVAELEAQVTDQQRQLDIATAALSWIVRLQPASGPTLTSLGIVKAFRQHKVKAIEALNRMFPEDHDEHEH